MGLYQKRLHFDKSDLLVVIGLVVLLSGISFTLGVLFGYGLNAGHVEHAGATSLTDLSHSLVDQSHDKNGKEEKKHVDDKPDPASTLRTAFRESKQQALNELALKEGTQDRPSSIADATAYLDQNPPLSRSPAAAEDDVDAEDKKRNDAAREEQAKRAEAGPPSSVKTLFERAPSSKDIFKPVPGTYTVQIASYPTQDESEAKLRILRQAGISDSYTLVIENQGGEKWYRVSVGAYPSPEWARKAGEGLIRRKLVADYLVREVK